VVCALLFLATTLHDPDRQTLSIPAPMLQKELKLDKAALVWRCRPQEGERVDREEEKCKKRFDSSVKSPPAFMRAVMHLAPLGT
jgi:hypothetical protein